MIKRLSACEEEDCFLPLILSHFFLFTFLSASNVIFALAEGCKQRANMLSRFVNYLKSKTNGYHLEPLKYISKVDSLSQANVSFERMRVVPKLF